MNVRRVLAVVGAVLAAGLIALAFWLVFFPPAPEPTTAPEPAATVTIAPEDPEPDVLDGHLGLGEENQHTHPECTDEERQRDSAAGGGFCGPVSALDGNEVIQLIDSHSALVSAFAQQWVTTSMDEEPDARAARLRKAGATDNVARSPSVFSRTDTAQAGLSGSSAFQEAGIIAPIDRDETGVSFSVPVNVTTSYRLPTGQGNDQRVGGTLTIWVDGSGAIAKVIERFPAMDRMR